MNEWNNKIKEVKGTDVDKIIKVSVNKQNDKTIDNVKDVLGQKDKDIFFINGLQEGNFKDLNVSTIIFIML